jgi:uncharacterized protein
MARPCKQRFVSTSPTASTFKPRGVPLCDLETVILSLDEFEALRLADLEGDQQEQAAAKMNVSRPTFGRILDHARRIVADALVHGKALQIEGGPVTIARRERVRCRRCQRAWEVPVPAATAFRCPHCGRGNEEDEQELGDTENFSFVTHIRENHGHIENNHRFCH